MATLDRNRPFGGRFPDNGYVEQDGKTFRKSDGVEVDPETHEVIKDRPIVVDTGSEKAHEITPEARKPELKWQSCTREDIMDELRERGISFSSIGTKGALWRKYQEALGK